MIFCLKPLRCGVNEMFHIINKLDVLRTRNFTLIGVKMRKPTRGVTLLELGT